MTTDAAVHNGEIIVRQEYSAVFNNNHVGLSDKSLSYEKLRQILQQNNWNFLTVILKRFYDRYNTVPAFANDEMILDFLNGVFEQHNNINTRKAYLTGLRRIYDIYIGYGILSVNPIKRLIDLRFIKLPRPEFKPSEIQPNITKAKIDLLMADENISQRGKAIISFLANTACRSSELIDLKKSDISKVRGEDFYLLKMYQRKTGKTNFVKLPASIFEFIEKNINKFANSYKPDPECPYFLQSRDGKQISRQGLRYYIETEWQKLYKDDIISAHRFRHFFATEKLVNEKYDVRTVQLLLNHASPSTTAAYAEVTTKAKDYSIIQTPEQTEAPNVVYIDRTEEILSDLRGRTKFKKTKTDGKMRDKINEDNMRNKQHIEFDGNVELSDDQLRELYDR
jgi:integrase